MTVWTPSGQSPLSLAQGHCVSWRLSLSLRPTFSLLLPLSPPWLLQAKSSRTGRYRQDGGVGVGWANKQVQILSWDNTWGSGWSGPHQGLSLTNSHALAKGIGDSPSRQGGRFFCLSAVVQCGQGGVPRGTAVANEEGVKECRSLRSPQVQCQGSLAISHFLFFLPFPLLPSQSPRTKSNNCTGGSSS